jgi:hypothetical protein
MKDAFEIEKERYGFEEIISPAAKAYLDEVEKKPKKEKIRLIKLGENKKCQKKLSVITFVWLVLVVRALSQHLTLLATESSFPVVLVP